jgi:hypothetical protein
MAGQATLPGIDAGVPIRRPWMRSSPLPFPAGKVITVGSFICKVLDTGVECTETGKASSSRRKP